MFEGVVEGDWRALAAADPDAEFLAALPLADRMPSYPTLDEVVTDRAQQPAAQRWSDWPPSGLLMDLLSAAADEPATVSESLDAVVAWERLIAHAQAAQLRAIARFAALRPGPDAEELAAYELAAELQLSQAAAGNRLTLAQVLTERLPATLEALSRGEIDLRKAQAVCDETRSLTAEQAAEVEAAVLAKAAQRDVSTIGWWRAALRREVLRADPGGAQRRHEAMKAERRVVVTPIADGMAELWALLPAPEAQAILTRLDTLAREAGGDRTMDQRRADCLVDVLLGRGKPGEGMGVEVQVTVAASTLLGLDDHPAELAGYGPISAEMARELAADARWRRLLTDPATGALKEVSRTTYRPPKALADHVRARDRHCVFPGCRQPAARCDLDHGVPFPEGETSATNLAPICRRHHIAKTRGGWRVSHTGLGVFAWTSPTGRRYMVRPEPYP